MRTSGIKGYVIRAWKLLLQQIFEFDRWHISSLNQRPYAVEIIRFLNKREIRNSVAEIGCGLGDILRNLKYSQKIGLDSDERVLKAARFLSTINFRPATFKPFSFPSSELSGWYDALLLVNWIHHIEPAILKSKIDEYFSSNLNEGGCIILDTVQDVEYKYNHDIRYLSNQLNCELVQIGHFHRQRDVWAIIKKHI